MALTTATLLYSSVLFTRIAIALWRIICLGKLHI